MNAEEFANEFVADLPDTLKHHDMENGRFRFCINVYNDDPNLNVLKSKLNAVGYDLIVNEPLSDVCKQSWKLVKI